MVKAELQRVKVINFMIKHNRAIPVDRSAGATKFGIPVMSLLELSFPTYPPDGSHEKRAESWYLNVSR